MKKHLALLILPLLLTSCGSNSLTVIEIAKKELNFVESDFNFEKLDSMPSLIDSHKFVTTDKETIDSVFNELSKIKLVYDESFTFNNLFDHPYYNGHDHYFVRLYSYTPKKNISFDLFKNGLVTFSTNAKDYYLIEENNPELFTTIGEKVNYGGLPSNQ